MIRSLRGKKIVRKIKISFCHGLVEKEDRYRKMNRRKRGRVKWKSQMRVNVDLKTEAQARESFRVPRWQLLQRDARVGNRWRRRKSWGFGWSLEPNHLLENQKLNKKNFYPFLTLFLFYPYHNIRSLFFLSYHTSNYVRLPHLYTIHEHLKTPTNTNNLL